MRNRNIFISVSALLLLFPVASALQAAGLSLANYSEVMVENLPIGGTYSMIQLVNLPLEVKNDSDLPIQLEITVAKPPQARLKKGFEPIPDISWVKIELPAKPIAPNGTYKADVVISIPDKREYLGKKYHADIIVRSKPTSKGMINIALAVQGRLLFTIDPFKKPAGAKAQTGVQLDFNFIPARVELSQVPLGKSTDVFAAGQKPVLIKNLSREKLTLALVSLDPKQTIVSEEFGYEYGPDPNFVTITKKDLVLEPGAEEALPLSVLIPDLPQYRGKHFQFIVSATTPAGQTTGKRYLRVMVETAPSAP